MDEASTPPNNEPKKEVEKYIPPLDDYSYPRISDVLGEPKFQSDLEHIVHSMINPDIYAMFGLYPDKSYLFYGPPGTGKTFAVKAIRNELIAQDKDVVYAPYDIGTYGTAYINQGAVNLQTFFNELRKQTANKDIGIAWFDEADVLLGNRQDTRYNHKEDNKVLETLMTNLQSLHSYGENMYVFFATNFKEALDPASIRAGRIDSQVEFKLPNKAALAQAYRYETNRRNILSGWQVYGDLNYETLADVSVGLNYADVNVITEGIIKEFVRRTVLDKEFRKLSEDKRMKRVSELNFFSTASLVKYIQQYRHSRENKINKPIGFS